MKIVNDAVVQGFSLIFFLFYLMMSTSLLYLSSSLLLRIVHNVMKTDQSFNQFLDLYVIRDLLMRDIHQAPRALSLWKKITNDALIWHDKKSDTGWIFNNNNKAIRIVGSYDAQRGIWQHAKKSLVGESVRCNNIDIITKNQNVIGVHIALKGLDNTVQAIEESFYVRQGAL